MSESMELLDGPVAVSDAEGLRQPPSVSGSMPNVLTIDVEDWFHVTNFENHIRRDDWDRCETRIQYTMPLLLDLLEEHNTRATFFVLGWVAERFPWIVRRIAEAGHELASHGQDHHLITDITPENFRRQIWKSRDVVEQVTGELLRGYRAPSYSLRKSTDWAISVMLEAGFEYDSSVFPFGFRCDPAWRHACFPYRIYDQGVDFVTEYPLATIPCAGHNMPIAGGGYFRLLPYGVIRWAVREINRKGFPAIMYLHPWELDPDQPRVHEASWLAKFRHYHQLGNTESKLTQLLRDFRFYSIRDVFWSRESQRYENVPQFTTVPME
ncbi:MAG: DUF3473 domain-containing protein [Candidatus Omnitrophica bacterium]|nr:DUF3473 domain-containing protein [Candidatus Omnitrophota bacterium]MDD5671200.1 DUF3473 domain-containing protein [Candidatus Omnitrophota bacterium]